MNPSLTVVTVVRNGEAVLEATLISIIQQTIPLQLVVIDGNSNDNTVDIIKKYSNHISYWISEPDLGIYDAMNKGVSAAIGDWVIFMNAGDTFYNSAVCATIFENLPCSPYPGVIYGNYVAAHELGKKVIKAKNLANFNTGMITSHQALFVRTSLVKKQPFRLDLKISADYYQLYSYFLEGITFFYSNTIVAIIDIGGVSYSKTDTIFENLNVARMVAPKQFRLVKFLPILCVAFIRSALGSRITDIVRKVKWKYLS